MPLAFSSVFNSIIFTRQLFVNITCHILIDPDKGNRRGRNVFSFSSLVFIMFKNMSFSTKELAIPEYLHWIQWRKLVITTLRAGYSVSTKFSRGLTKPRSKVSWIMPNLLSEHSVREQCQEGWKLAMKGIYLIKTTLHTKITKGPLIA